MKKIIQRLISALLCISMLISLLAGCVSGNDNEDNTVAISASCVICNIVDE